ncbi:MAG: toprim domain-containing protein, partial [Filifactoraceae bacterium]
PDRDVFTETDISVEYYLEIIKRQAVINKGIKFVFTDEESKENFVFKYEDGIKDYIKEKVKDDFLTEINYFSFNSSGKDREDKPEYKLKSEFSFCFSNNINLIEYYHNSSFLEHGGSPDKAMKSAFIYVIDQYLKNNNKYLKSEKKIIFQDIQESLVYVSNSFSTMTSYENQTKKSVTNKFIQEAITDFLKSQLEIYFIENKEEAEKIANQILINKRSRENAEKTRVAIKTRLLTGMDPLNKVKKFVDCRTKDTGKRELYIVEGDSALGACKLGRNADFQAIIPIRGKILNCLKADYNKIFANEIITDIIKILGTGVEVKSKYIKDIADFNLNNLRWDKVIICTDADVDGYQIRTLLLTMFYTLTPTLIQEGKIFIADSPLFEITSGKDTFFAYNENEKQKIIKKLKGKYHIQRSKGLGENDPEMMWETTMNPESRKLIQVTPSEVEETKTTFELLLGDDLAGRKTYIETYGHIYLDQIDEA